MWKRINSIFQFIDGASFSPCCCSSSSMREVEHMKNERDSKSSLYIFQFLRAQSLMIHGFLKFVTKLISASFLWFIMKDFFLFFPS